jgi:predicted metal-dependent HD superfamily phosphohydrolase
MKIANKNPDIAIDETLIGEATLFIENLLKKELSATMHFHNLLHTKMVFRSVSEIGKHCGLDKIDLNVLRISALFHDCGYTRRYKGHEREGIAIATDFLNDHAIHPTYIERVSSCINATQFPQQPGDNLGKIMCDADLYHLSLHDYPVYAEKLRRELAETVGCFFTKHDWNRTNLELLLKHRYFTGYGSKVLEFGKQQNIVRLSALCGRSDNSVSESDMPATAFNRPAAARI